MTRTVFAPDAETTALPLITRSERSATDMSVSELVSESQRLIASASYLVVGIEKNIATATAMVTAPLVRR